MPGMGLAFALLLPAAGSPRLEFALGILAEARGDAPAAAIYFESARSADPLALLLVERGVRARLADGDRFGAVKLYRDLAAARPADLGVQITYADFLEQQARGDALARQLAKKVLEAALSLNPGHPQVIRRLFQQALAAADGRRQSELLGQLSTDDPEAVLLYASLSENRAASEDAAAREMVDQHFRRGFDLHPGNAELARAASDHFRDTQRPELAISILERHVETAPSSLELRTRLGVLYFTARRDGEGEAALKEVLAIHPRHELAHQSLAKFYRLRGMQEPARTHADELLKIRGGAPADFLQLAEEWLAADEAAKARILLEKAVFNHPENPHLADKLAIASRRDPAARGQAARLFREAEALRPAKQEPGPAFLVEFAEALLDAGDAQAAEERLRAAIRAFPPEAKKETAAALRSLARLWESGNRNGTAASALRQRADALDR